MLLKRDFSFLNIRQHLATLNRGQEPQDRIEQSGGRQLSEFDRIDAISLIAALEVMVQTRIANYIALDTQD